MNQILPIVLMTCLLLLTACTSTPAQPTRHASTKVMSFNIRYLTNDGENSWQNRHDMVIDDVIRFHRPDLLGAQECLLPQVNLMRERLSEDYGFVGVGRRDGHEEGEFAAIFYLHERYELLDSGHFWLSDTPNVVGSVGWDAALPRICTWAKLRDMDHQQTIFFANTHFDHRGQQARIESAALIRQRLETLQEADELLIVTGDFNARPNGQAHQTLVGEGSGLQDTFMGDETLGTSHGFTGRREGSRIDWVLADRRFDVSHFRIDHFNNAGRYPSDHYPVIAILRLP